MKYEIETRCHCHRVGTLMVQREELDNIPADAARYSRDTATALDVRTVVVEVEIDKAQDHAVHTGRRRPQAELVNKEERSDEGDSGYVPDLWASTCTRSLRPEAPRRFDDYSSKRKNADYKPNGTASERPLGISRMARQPDDIYFLQKARSGKMVEADAPSSSGGRFPYRS